ncbi:Fur family transcriptional regulator, peroxide stress response regulator [Ardenticatena maritima]|uniref:Fur family transcriptional regulator, peroxide stress response regulator n=1 Tax=Ardenticatena maritima TaxID=872965 RepID=A0A0M9UDU4_9CHLR|nr:Fur family transcriptional regulator [Ardenticatena maritima]GAP64340.1 Fur family transcriptional regulator, peroxide stress response regulator [Ardenticatena maritima]
MTPTAEDQELIQRLQAANMRVTPQRLLVWRTVRAMRGHPTAQDVYARIHAEHPTLGLATVYNTLDLFTQLGLLRAFDTGGVVRYDTHTDAHINLICDVCGRIEDIHIPESATWRRMIEEQSGYEVHGHIFDVHGRCPTCQAANQEADNDHKDA